MPEPRTRHLHDNTRVGPLGGPLQVHTLLPRLLPGDPVLGDVPFPGAARDPHRHPVQRLLPTRVLALRRQLRAERAIPPANHEPDRRVNRYRRWVREGRDLLGQPGLVIPNDERCAFRLHNTVLVSYVPPAPLDHCHCIGLSAAEE